MVIHLWSIIHHKQSTMTLIPKEVVRLYNMEDEQMQTRATTMHGNATNDLADFTAKFPWFDTTYLASVETDIATAMAFQTDDMVVDAIKVLTEDVHTSMSEGMRALDTLDVYARLAYPNSPARQRVFGQDNWARARNDQQKMVNALEHAFLYANQTPYKTDLMNKGMGAADIAALDSIAQNIALKDKMQEAAKSSRPVTTEDRIKLNNIVWGRLQVIATCAELVYRDDAAKLAQYRLYPPASEMVTEVTVNVKQGGNPLPNATVALSNTAIDPVLTNTEGDAHFTNNSIPEMVSISVSHPNYGNYNFGGFAIVQHNTNYIAVSI